MKTSTKLLATAAALATTCVVASGPARASEGADMQTQMEMCATFMILSHEAAPQYNLVGEAGWFLLTKAAERRGKGYDADEQMKLRAGALMLLVQQPDKEKFANDIGVGCMALAYANGLTPPSQAPKPPAKSSRGNAQQEALGKQLKDMPGVSRW